MFFKIESWNFQVQFEIEFRETSQNFNSFSIFRQLLFSSFFIGCLIELNFCKVSRNSISSWTWKFQLSLLKNKKVLFLKRYFLKQKNFVHWLHFQGRFWSKPLSKKISIRRSCGHMEMGTCPHQVLAELKKKLFDSWYIVPGSRTGAIRIHALKFNFNPHP